MATHLDLEEQEQLDQIKHFWAQYGNLITWGLVLALGAFAAWNGWQFWQTRNAQQATVLYDELERAAQARDAERVQRVLADLQDGYSRTSQAQQGALIAARALHEAERNDGAKAALQWVVEKSGDQGYQALARLRLAGLAMEAKAYDEALKWLEGSVPVEFVPLVADRRGDVLLAQGQRDNAKAQYMAAYRDMDDTLGYRRLIEAKLAALGVDLTTIDTKQGTAK